MRTEGRERTKTALQKKFIIFLISRQEQFKIFFQSALKP